MEDIKDILEDIGLSEKETAVYRALLKLREATASRISEIAELNRVTTYTILKGLQEKGFCSVFDRNKVQYFKPTKPEGIIGLLEEKKNKIKLIIPMLKEEERGIEEKPEVGLFEGKKGIGILLDNILKDAENDKEVLAYGNVSISEKLIEYQSLHWRKTRIAKKIKIKAVVDSLENIRIEQAGWKSLSEVKKYEELEKFLCYTLITRNLVAYLAFGGELTGILIKNKDIVNKEKFNFNQIWKGS
jgi:sugar-specific transcriptional regulator TrmB